MLSQYNVTYESISKQWQLQHKKTGEVMNFLSIKDARDYLDFLENNK